jgi:excinuclease ABC subunit C
VTREDYRRQIRALCLVLEGKKARLLAELQEEMQQASAALQFERAARLRDEIESLSNLGMRGDVDKDVQPEVFYIEPRKGLIGLRKVLGLPRTPRTIEGVDIAHLGGDETVASLVRFIDGLPFKPGYRRYRIRSVEGVDDFASIREVVTRRFRRERREEDVFPDILLIDGGKGQLSAADDAFRLLGVEPPCLISLAKREEEVFRLGEPEPLRLSRHAAALRLLQYVRDEAHRFAQHYHHILRRKKLQDE